MTTEGIYAKRFKKRDEFTAEEELAYRKDGTVPEVDENERARLEDAGFCPDTHRPLADVEAERERSEKRQTELADAEALTVEDWVARIQAGQRA